MLQILVPIAARNCCIWEEYDAIQCVALRFWWELGFCLLAVGIRMLPLLRKQLRIHTPPLPPRSRRPRLSSQISCCWNFTARWRWMGAASVWRLPSVRPGSGNFTAFKKSGSKRLSVPCGTRTVEEPQFCVKPTT